MSYVSEYNAQVRAMTAAAGGVAPSVPQAIEAFKAATPEYATSGLAPSALGNGQILEAGFGALIPGAIGLISKVWPWLMGLGAGAGIAGMLGEGGEVVPTGGAGGVVPGTQYGVPFGGPGLAEPGKPYLLKEWHIRFDSKEGDFECQYYLTQIPGRKGKRIFMYNQRTKAWSTWTPPRLAVIGKNMPSHRMLSRLRGNLSRQTKDATLVLKLTAPHRLAKPKHRYHYRGRRN